MSVDDVVSARRESEERTASRAFELASSRAFSDLRDLISALRSEGYLTVQTDLRSRTLRRELRAMFR